MGALPLYRDAIGVFYSPSWLGKCQESAFVGEKRKENETKKENEKKKKEKKENEII